MIVRSIEGGYDKNFSYIIGCEKSRKGAIIDAAIGAETLIKSANEANLEIQYLIITHSHHDHYAWAEALLKKLRDLTLITYGDTIMNIGEKEHIDVEDGEEIYLGSIPLTFYHTPGHFPDSVCVVADGAVFTGDTLFIGRPGRTRSPKSDVEALYHSINDKLLTLPDDTKIYPGHNYGEEPVSTIGEQKATNEFLQAESPGEFAKLMEEYERQKEAVT
ncbi:MAG TPA: MBL fold metallo-hydrolase [bacterium]|nr:MBL fold metallo-hydrolase [bacterium]